MTAAVQDALIEGPALLTVDESRDAVRRAIILAAQHHATYVHASWVRPFLPAGVRPQDIGNVFNKLWSLDILVPTAKKQLRSEGGSGNANKRLTVWRLTKPIPKDALR